MIGKMMDVLVPVGIEGLRMYKFKIYGLGQIR